MYLSFYPSIYLYLSIYLPIYLYPSIYSIYMYMYLSYLYHLFIYLISMYLSFYHLHVSIFLSIYMYLSTYLYFLLCVYSISAILWNQPRLLHTDMFLALAGLRNLCSTLTPFFLHTLIDHKESVSQKVKLQSFGGQVFLPSFTFYDLYFCWSGMLLGTWWFICCCPHTNMFNWAP